MKRKKTDGVSESVRFFKRLEKTRMFAYNKYKGYDEKSSLFLKRREQTDGVSLHEKTNEDGF